MLELSLAKGRAFPRKGIDDRRGRGKVFGEADEPALESFGIERSMCVHGDS